MHVVVTQTRTAMFSAKAAHVKTAKCGVAFFSDPESVPSLQRKMFVESCPGSVADPDWGLVGV